MTSKDSLSKDDWVQAAFRALTKGGPQAVKVERIARDLKVSKGSFYWHFKDAKALKIAMLKHWEKVGTKDIIYKSKTNDLSPFEKFAALESRITKNRDVPYGGLLTEGAIRDWSRFDPDVAKVVRRVNKARLAYIAQLFADLGLSQDDSRMKAQIVYSAMIGFEFLEHQKLGKMSEGLRLLVMQLIKPGN